MRPAGTFVSAVAVPFVMTGVDTPLLITDNAVTYGRAARPPWSDGQLALFGSVASSEDWSGVPVFDGDAACTAVGAINDSEPSTNAATDASADFFMSPPGGWSRDPGPVT